jgi:hypothetical protein
MGKARAALTARFAGLKRWIGAGRRRSKHLRNVLALLMLVGAYLIRVRSERSRWERWRAAHGH